jgi:hypothetical protein
MVFKRLSPVFWPLVLFAWTITPAIAMKDERMAMSWAENALSLLHHSREAMERVTDATYETLPYPKIEFGKQAIVVAWCRADAPGTGRSRIWPPFKTALIPYPNNKPMKVRPSVPQDYGLRVGPDGSLGAKAWNKDPLPREYAKEKRRYLELLSIVLKQGWLLGGSDDRPKQKEIARELKELLPRLTLANLGPYDRIVGSVLQQWMDQIL